MKVRSVIIAAAAATAAGLASCNAPAVDRGAELERFHQQIAQRAAALDIKPGAVLSMADCEKLALQNSLQLSVQRLTLRLQDDQVRLSLASGLPKANLRYTDVRRSNEPLVSFDGFTTEMEDRQTKNFAVNATIPVLDFGTTYYAYQIAKDRRTQQELLLKRSEQQLRRDVRIAYARLASAQRQEKVTIVNVNAAEQILRVGESLERAALATGADTAVLRAALAQTRVERAMAAQKVSETRLELARLMSLPPGVDLRIDENLPPLPAPPDGTTMAGLEEHALRVRPELAVQDLELHVSANTVRGQIAAFFPRVDGIGSFNWTSNSFMVNPAFFLFGFQVASSLLDGGTQIWQYNLAKKGMTIEEERTLLLSLAVLYDVDLRAIQLHRNRETITALEESERARRRAFEQILSLYKEGLENEAGTAKALGELNVQSLALDRAQTDYLVTWFEFQAAVLPEEKEPAAKGSGPTTAPATRPAETMPAATPPATQSDNPTPPNAAAEKAGAK